MLSVKGLTIRFGGLVAVNDVSFEIKKGEIFGLIGPNGAGKTTTFNLISGVYKPTAGTIEFQGQRIDGKRPWQVNHLGISRTYQNINLFKKMSVLENVMVGCHSQSKKGLFSSIFRTPGQRKEERAIEEKSRQILDTVDLGAKAAWPASGLSYGEQRRLEIARAIASDPQLILLDEPAAGMNHQEKIELNKTIKAINQMGITVLLVEHDMAVVMKISDRVCVLNHGRLLALDGPVAIQKNPAVIDAYLGSNDEA